MKKYLFLILVFILNMTQGHASTEADFSLAANTQTSITVPANRHTYVEYTVTNNTAITRRLTTAPIPYVTQITTTSSQCAKYFTLAPGGTCKLTFYVNGASIKKKYTGGPIVCKTKVNSNEPDRFLCSQPEPSMVLSLNPAPAVPTPAKKMYVTNWDGNNISLCYLNSGTITACLISGISDSFKQPEALALNNNTHILFVANIGGGISSCVIHPVSGELTACKDAAPEQPIYAPTGIAIQNTTAYIANSGPELFHQGVTTCTVNGSVLSHCTFTQGNASFSVPSDLAISNGTVYITNFNSQNLQTSYCTIGNHLCTTATGEGVVSGTSNLLNEPEGIMFATINAKNYVYFTNHGNHTVTSCKVTNATTFSNCSVTGGYFTGFGNLAISTSPAKAFIPTGLKKLARCDVSSTNGGLSNCVTISNVSFNNPSGLLIL